ncbi:MAG: hypothetical protein IT462_14880 [Planctomycetes bacterium]|nr:hypothetical protein [Planctomycetota bacterium]
MKNFFLSKLLAATALVLAAAVGASSLQAQYEPKCFYTFTGPGDGNIRQLDNPNVVLSFRIDEYNGYDTILNYVYFSFATETYFDDIDHATLWEDNDGDGTMNGNESEIYSWWPDNYGYNYQLSDIYFYPGSWISGGSYQNYIVTVDLRDTASPGNSVQLQTWENWECYSYDYYWWSNVWEANGNGYAIGPYMTIVPNNANLALWGGTQVPASNVIRGALRQPLMQFRLTSDGTGQEPQLTYIRVYGDTGVSPPHSAQVADVINVRLYKEVIVNGLVDATEMSLPGYPQTGVSIGGTFGWQFPCSEVITTGGTNFLVVADIAGTAVVNNVFRMTTSASSSYFGLTQGSPSWSGGVFKVTDEAQTIKNPLATYLEMTVQPGTTLAGNAINNVAPVTTGVRLVARKPDTTIDTTFTSPVTASIASGPAGFTPASTTTVQCLTGEAIFYNLNITKTGTYTIRFVSLPLTEVISLSFTVTPKPATKIVIISGPQNGVVGEPLPPPPVAHAFDLYNNLDYNFTGDITASLQANPAGSSLLNNVLPAVSGQVTFPNLLMNRDAVGYTMVFSAAGLTTSSASAAFNVAIGDPYQIVILQQPGGATGGVPIPIAPRLQVQDWGGNEVIAYSGQMSAAIGANPGSGVLSGTTAVPVVSAESTFPDLIIDKAGAGYTLVFSIEAGAISVETNSFDVQVGAPVRIGIVQQPGDSTGGLALGQSPIVQIEDQGGNLVNDNTSKTTASITAGSGAPGAMLSGTLQLTMASGVATFSDLNIDKATATAYTLTFSSDSGYASVTSATFVISVGPAYKLAVATQPGMASYGVPFVQQPVVEIQDAGGNLVPTATHLVSASLDPASGTIGATLQGTASVAAVAGVVTFANLQINLPGVNFKLVFDDAGILVAVDSALFSVASTATQLGVSVHPTLSAASQALLTQPVVEVRDANSVLVSVDFYTQVTAEIMPNTGTPGAALVGTTTMLVTNGIAAFTNLRVSMPGVAYRLRFTCFPALTATITDAFDVHGAAVKLTLTGQPQGSDAGEYLDQQPRIEVRDANDVLCVTDNTTRVNAYITPATGSAHAILSGTNPLMVVNGVALFTDLSIDRPGQGYSLSFSCTPSLYSQQSDAFDIIGEMPPSQNTENDVVAGLDGGSCSGQTNIVAPWLLLAVVALMASVTLRRRAKQ